MDYREIPSVLYYGQKDGIETYALFNWSNMEDTIELRFLNEKYVRSYYGKMLYAPSKKFALTLAPHDSEIIYVADDEKEFEKLGDSILW